MAKDSSLKTQWVANYKKFNKIANLADFFLPNQGLDFWNCNISLEDAEKLSISNHFWRDVAISWAKFNWHSPKSTYQILEQVIWLNSHIKIKNQLVSAPQTWKNGCRLINDLIVDSPMRFLSYEQFSQRFGQELSWIQYSGLISAIPPEWKKLIKDPIIDHEIDSKYTRKFETIPTKISKLAYENFIRDKDKLKKEHQQWSLKLAPHALTISYDLFLSSFLKLREYTSSPKYGSFQYRLLHRKIFLNKILKIWGLSDTDRCTWCRDHYETIEHFFFFCDIAQNFWRKIRCWYEALTDAEISLS